MAGAAVARAMPATPLPGALEVVVVVGGRRRRRAASAAAPRQRADERSKERAPTDAAVGLSTSPCYALARRFYVLPGNPVSAPISDV